MPLTPQAVREKVFTPTRFKTGYDEDEVDAFLDEVEAELGRLLADNATLRDALETRPAAAAEPVAAAAPAAAPSASAPEAGVMSLSGPPATPGQAELEEMLRRTLLLAQRTADEVVAEARAEADRLVAEARSTAEATVTAARDAAEQERQVSAAGQASDLAAYESERHRLEALVERLRTFEEEYRARLRAYLEMQLREIDDAPSSTALPGRDGPAQLAAGGDPPAARAGRA